MPIARATALRLDARASKARLNSLPIYHAFYVALWTALPALLFLTIWAPVQSSLVAASGARHPGRARRCPRSTCSATPSSAEARDIASGAIEAGFNPEATALAPIFAEVSARFATIGGAVAIALALRRRLPRHAPHQDRFPRPQRGRALGHGAAGRRVADRDPDHARDRPVAVVRIACASSAWSARPNSCSGRRGARRPRCAPTRRDRRARSDRSPCSGARRSSARSSP